ncbi:MAG: PRC-barrel domain-containing protein [Nanoarchaeota archaeon]
MRIKKISDAVGTRVYTDAGDYFGEIEEANLSENKVDGWRIKVGGSVVSLIGGARGVIIPHQFVKAIGDIFVINKSALPSEESQDFGESGDNENLGNDTEDLI